MTDVSDILERLSEVEEANVNRKHVGYARVCVKRDAEQDLRMRLRETHLLDAVSHARDIIEDAGVAITARERAIYGVLESALLSFERPS